MTDWYTDELFALPPDAAVTVRFPVSRLIVDPERFEDPEAETDGSRRDGRGVHQDVAGARSARRGRGRARARGTAGALLPPPSRRPRGRHGGGAGGSRPLPHHRLPQLPQPAAPLRVQGERRPLEGGPSPRGLHRHRHDAPAERALRASRHAHPALAARARRGGIRGDALAVAGRRGARPGLGAAPAGAGGSREGRRRHRLRPAVRRRPGAPAVPGQRSARPRCHDRAAPRPLHGRRTGGRLPGFAGCAAAVQTALRRIIA